MKAFVSYSRRDNSLGRLLSIESQIGSVTELYIDDLHFPRGVDRHTSVLRALMEAESFIAVLSSNYLHTPWTLFEARQACVRGIPVFAFSESGELFKTRYEDLSTCCKNRVLGLPHAGPVYEAIA
ncbi:TIR domain-containing protein [Rhodococcus wratislaviensis]|uniref:TIR domain-containing protein n=1 Tax=Rhodococcus wratislaviensis TaxID=44752 RepID=UPI001788AE91